MLASMNVWLLSAAYAFAMSGVPIVILTGSFSGLRLAPAPEFATLPVAAMIVGTAVSTMPAVLAMRRFGRKRVFIALSCSGILMAGFAGLASDLGNFWLFSLALFFQGASTASAQQFRFAAQESVASEHAPTAASTVVLGGLLAAWLGPEVAGWTRHMGGAEWSGSYYAASVFHAAALLSLFFYREQTGKQDEKSGPVRPLGEILGGRSFPAAVSACAASYAIMSYVMTATPLGMQGHGFADTKLVIQSHSFAMFLPSFFTGLLLEKFGVFRLMVAGSLLMASALGVAFSSQAFLAYFFTLVFLGLGWNFLFLSGTSLLHRIARPGERFRVQAANDFLTFSMNSLGSLMAGVALANWGWGILILSAFPFLAVQVALMLRWAARSDG